MNCKLELSYRLAELFNICLKESVFQIFKNVGEGLLLKKYCPVSLLSVVNKVFEKLVNNRTVDQPEKCSLVLIPSMILGLLDQSQTY